MAVNKAPGLTQETAGKSPLAMPAYKSIVSWRCCRARSHVRHDLRYYTVPSCIDCSSVVLSRLLIFDKDPRDKC